MKKNTVHDLIKQKKYFDVGFHWYFDRYLSFFWQKRLFYFLFFITILTLSSLLYMNKKILIDPRIISPVVIYIDNYDEVAFIRKLQSNNTNDPNILIANYLVEKYAMIRESYSYENLQEQTSFIRNNSTSFLSLKFEEYMSILNIHSPLLLYGKQNKLNVVIKNIHLKMDDANSPTNAKAELSIYRNNDLLLEKTIEIEFYMSDTLSLEKQKSGNFKFLVFKYHAI